MFDGVCVLCSRAVRYVLHHDRSDPPIRFVAITSSLGRRLAEENGVDPDNPHTFIFIENGQGHVLSEAIFAMAGRAGGPGRFIRIFRVIPRPLRDWVYARLANNRYRLFGKLKTCYLPKPEHADRFILN